MKLKAYAPAKINLGLEILSKRPDGYHNVDMIMQSINLFDEVTLEETFDGKISVFNEKNTSCPQNEDIAFKCADLFFKETKVPFSGIKIEIKKNIPISAGLAGGSADGAAVLVLLNHMYDEKVSLNELLEIGGKIGADIPFCILGGTARASGKGTEIKKIPEFNDYFLVLTKPGISICTKRAYSLFDSAQIKNFKSFEKMEESLKNADFSGFSGSLFNRFEELVQSSEVFNIKKKMLDLGAVSSLMSGSGPSVYGVFEDETTALKCLSEVKKFYPQTFLCRPIDHGVKII